MVLAWENLRSFCSFCCCCCCSSFIFIDHYLHYQHCRCFGDVSSFDFQATFPCHWHSVLASQTSESLHQPWALPRLLSIAFSFSSTSSAMVLSGHFLPRGVFYLTLLPDIFGTSQHFGTTCFYQGFTGNRQLFSGKLQGFIVILETQTCPMCLFDSQWSTIFYTS